MLEQILKEIGEVRREIAVQSVELAKNTTETTNVVKRLDVLNGTVARHERENIAFTAAIKALETFKEAQEDKAKGQSSRAQMFVDKVLWGAVVIIALLAYKVLTTVGIVQDFIN